MSRGAWLALGLALAAWLPARADEAALRRALQAFDYMALWSDNQHPVPTRKWLQPIRWRIDGRDPAGWRAPILEAMDRIAKLTGLDIAQARDGEPENFLFLFEETSAYFVAGRAAGCYATTRLDPRTPGGIGRAELRINLSQRGALRACIVHEMMHGFGFPGHPHELDSVLSYTMRREDLTELDESALRTLYDARVPANFYHLPALTAARQVIAERLGLVAKGVPADKLATAYLDEAVTWLQRAGAAGNVFASSQLGNAYWFGHHVAIDAPAALDWWTRAAEAGDSHAAFLLGVAMANGEKGVAKSEEAALRWYRMAAARGHASALNNLGLFTERGTATAVDPVEALAHYELAAAAGVPIAKANAERLRRTMGADAIARAQARAAEIKASFTR